MRAVLCIAAAALLCSAAGRTCAGSLLPQPRSNIRQAGYYTPPREIRIQTPTSGSPLVRTIIDSAASKSTKPRIRIEEQAASGWWLRIGNVPMPTEPKGDEAYRLDVSPGGIAVVAGTGDGLRHGVRTLLQILEDGSPIPACRIDDSPALAHRALMIDMIRLKEKDETYFRLLEEMAAWKMNALYLHFTDNEGCSIELRSHPELVTRNAMSQETLKKLIARGAELGVRIIPEVELWGHAYWITVPHPELAEVGSDSLCLSNEALYPLAEDVIKEVAALFPDPWLHIGCDEGTFGKDDTCKARVEAEGAAKIIADHINRVNSIVRKHGKTSVVWGDFKNWPKGVPALLDRSIIAEPWYYNPGITRREVTQFSGLGFKTLGAPAISCRGNKVCPGSINLQNVRDWSFALKQENAEGVASTIWATHRLLPTTLGPGIAWAADQAWNPGDPDIDDTMAGYLANRFGLIPTADRIRRLRLLGETDQNLTLAFWKNDKALADLAKKDDQRDPESLKGFSDGFKADARVAKRNRRDLEALALAAEVSEHLALRRAVGRQTVERIEQARGHLAENKREQTVGKLTAAAEALRTVENDRSRLFALMQQTWDEDRYHNDPERAGTTGDYSYDSHIAAWHVAQTLYWWFAQPESFGYAQELIRRLENAAKDPTAEALAQLPPHSGTPTKLEQTRRDEMNIEAECIPGKVQVSQAVNLEVRIRCSQDLSAGDKVEVQFPNSWMMLTGPSFTRSLQTDDPDGEHYISASSADGRAEFAVEILPRQLNFPEGTGRHGRLIVATLVSGQVTAGEPISIGYANTLAPYVAETESVWVRVRGTAPRTPPALTSLAGDAVTMRVIAPSTALPGEPFSVLIVSLDRFDNCSATRFEDGSLRLEDDTPIAEHLAFTGSTRVPARIQTEGVHRIRFGEALSNPIRVSREGRRVYWGDLHIHTKLSHDGQGNAPYEYARDVSGLDFAAVADHVESLGPEGYDQLLRWASDAGQPGKFVTMLADERIPPITGHHNIYFRDVESFLAGASRDGKRRLVGSVDPERVMLIPHHTGIRFGDLRAKTDGVDLDAWDDGGARPVMEIYSHHGQSELYSPQHILSYEFNRMRNPERRANTSTPGPHYAQDYWMAGRRLGVIASSDEHSGQGGRRHGGITAVMADTLTRESVFDCIRGRRCYATTGERILLDFQINGSPMGSEISAKAGDRASIDLRVWATEPITRVDILRFRFGVDREFGPLLSSSPRPESRDASFHLEDTIEGPCVYYARLVQEPLVWPGMAWTSPIWVDTQ